MGRPRNFDDSIFNDSLGSGSFLSGSGAMGGGSSSSGGLVSFNRPTFAMRAKTSMPVSELIECGARAASKNNVNIMLDVVDSKSDQDEYWRGQQDCMQKIVEMFQKDKDNIEELARESLRQHYLKYPNRMKE